MINKYIKRALLCSAVLSSAISAEAVLTRTDMAGDTVRVPLRLFVNLTPDSTINAGDLIIDDASYGSFNGTVAQWVAAHPAAVVAMGQNIEQNMLNDGDNESDLSDGDFSDSDIEEEQAYLQALQASQFNITNIAPLMRYLQDLPETELQTYFTTIVEALPQYADDINAVRDAIASNNPGAAAALIVQGLQTDPDMMSAIKAAITTAVGPAVTNQMTTHVANKRCAEITLTLSPVSIMQSTLDVSNIITSRLATTGVGSGDEADNSYGVWLKGMGSRSTQKETNRMFPYTSTGYGFSLGGDINLGNGVVGLAYSMVKSDAKFKVNIANKTAATSHIFTLYGSADIAPRVIVSGQLRGGIAKLKNSVTVASSKPKATMYGGTVNIGYDAAITETISLIPSLGLSHDQIKIKGHAIGANKMGAVKATKTSTLLGLTLKNVATLANDNKLVSEAHITADMAMKNTIGAMTYNATSYDSIKLPKKYYKIGGSVEGSLGTINLGLGYDFGFGKKYQSHAGFIKARINL